MPPDPPDSAGAAHLGRAAELDARAAASAWAELEREAEAADAAGGGDGFAAMVAQRVGGFLEPEAAGAAAALPEPDDAVAWLDGAVPGVHIVREIGRGGMGVVYEGVEVATSRIVAVKLLHIDRRTPALVRRMKREARALGRVEHPGIARLYAAGACEGALAGSPYVVMELVRGRGPLAYAEDDGLSIRDKAALVRRIAEAVGAAHEQGVLHLDLKADNVLVCDDGSIKLLDFGIARVLDESAVTGELGAATLLTHPFGTPGSMSPEQVRGRSATPASDVYALGVLLYRLLTGRPPIDAAGLPPSEASRRVAEVDAPRPRAANRAVPRDLDVVVSVALARDPSDRYPTAGDLGADLERFLSGAPIAARPIGPLGRARRLVARHPWPAATAALVALALSGLSAVSVVMAIDARAAQAAAQQRADDVRALANKMIFDLHDAVEPLPGSTPVRRLIVDTGLEYLDALAASGAATPDVRREIAEGYLRIGEVLGNQRTANLGDLEGSAAALARAIAELELLLVSSPRDVELRRMLATAHTSIMYATDEDGQSHAEQGLKLREEIWEERPDDLRAMADLAYSQRMVAAHLLNSGRTDEGLVALESAIRRIEAWPSFAASPGGMAHLVAAKYLLGFHRWEHEGAGRDTLREALAMQKRLVAQRPDDASLLSLLGTIHSSVARAVAHDGAREEATESAAEALRLSLYLHERDPDNQDTHRQWSVATGFAGMTYEALASHAPDATTARNDMEQALRYYTRYRETVAERDERGWLHPWESHYTAEAEEFVARCEAKLAELDAELADGS